MLFFNFIRGTLCRTIYNEPEMKPTAPAAIPTNLSAIPQPLHPTRLLWRASCPVQRSSAASMVALSRRLNTISVRNRAQLMRAPPHRHATKCAALATATRHRQSFACLCTSRAIFLRQTFLQNIQLPVIALLGIALHG